MRGESEKNPVAKRTTMGQQSRSSSSTFKMIKIETEKVASYERIEFNLF